MKVVELGKDVSNTESNSKWVDWVKEFGKRIDQLSKIDDPKNQNDFLKGVVDKIEVTKSDQNNKYQILNIYFKLPFVDDRFEWKDVSKKSKGYSISDGDFTKKIDVSSMLKK